MNFKVIQSDNSKEWNSVLNRIGQFDFYHTASYHQLDESGKSRLLVFEQDDVVMAIPFVFRNIPKTHLKDVTSVYGYAGWIRNCLVHLPEAFTIMSNYFKEEKVVSAFSRLHPLIEGSGWFDEGEVGELNTTVAIDMSIPPDSQWKLYSESVRRTIKKSKAAGMLVRIATKDTDIELFAKIYRNAMRTLGAQSHYYFSDEYFHRLIHDSDLYKGIILIAEIDGKPAGGGMFTFCNQFMQYHLGAIVEEYRSYSPLKLIIDQARLLAPTNNSTVLHLGGGNGGENNNLFVFKSRMSSLQYPFKVWKWVVDEANYASLCSDKPVTSFFPLYRER